MLKNKEIMKYNRMLLLLARLVLESLFIQEFQALKNAIESYVTKLQMNFF